MSAATPIWLQSGMVGTGVEVSRLERKRDVLLDDTYRTANGTAGETTMRRDTLTEVQNIFGEHRTVHLCGEPSDDGTCRASGRKQPDFACKINPGYGFSDSRHIGQSGRAPGGGASEQACLMRTHKWLDRGERRDKHRHLACHEGRYSLPGTFVGHMDQVNARSCLDRLHGNVMQAADAGRGIAQLSRMGTCLINERAQSHDR